MEDLRAAAKDDSLQAIIILVNSPGGSPAASHAIYEEIERLRAKKPVVCCMTDVAASGGYYVASACDKIVAQGSTLTGSIGVIFGGMAYYGLMQKLGLSNATQTAGKYKDVGSPLRPMRPEEKALMQAMLDDIYGQFVAAVAKGRKLDVAKVRTLAEGRVYTGAQAKAVGLVDQLGNFYDALKLAGELAHIKGEPKVEYLGEPTGLFGGMLGSSERFGGLLGGRGSLLQPQLPALQGPMLVLPYVYEMIPVVSGMQP
jgi:protease-4